MPLSAIGYISHAVPPWDRACFETLVQRAAAFNLQVGVTGVVLFDGRRFFQYIEGPPEGLRAAYARVLRSHDHTDLMELGRAQLGRRLVPYWSMHWLLADPTQVRAVAYADWTGFIPTTRWQESPRFGTEHLLSYLRPHVSA